MLEKLLATPDILKIIAAPLVGLVPVLINLLINWLDKRSHAFETACEVDHCKKEIQSGKEISVQSL